MAHDLPLGSDVSARQLSARVPGRDHGGPVRHDGAGRTARARASTGSQPDTRARGTLLSVSWDRWFGVVASAATLAVIVNRTLGMLVTFAGLLVFVAVRLHMSYGRPSDLPYYEPRPPTREEWGVRMARDFEARYPALFPRTDTTQERRRRDPSIAVPRRNESHKPRLGSRKPERQRTVRVAGCLPHI